MTKTKEKYRLITSKRESAKKNMALDELLIKNYDLSAKPILRLYQWNKSYTLGVSQKPEDYKYLCEYSKDYSKRVTGGGVLFHGHDISYSLIIPTKYMLGLSIKESYEKICTFLLNFYKELGLNAKYAKDDESIELSKSPFCQVGFEAYDILIDSIKIGGNAQRRTKQVIFQHGSIPVEKASYKGKIGSCLKDFAIELSYEEIEKRLKESFESTFEVELIDEPLTDEEELKLAELIKEKYDYTK